MSATTISLIRVDFLHVRAHDERDEIRISAGAHTVDGLGKPNERAFELDGDRRGPDTNHVNHALGELPDPPRIAGEQLALFVGAAALK